MCNCFSSDSNCCNFLGEPHFGSGHIHLKRYESVSQYTYAVIFISALMHTMLQITTGIAIHVFSNIRLFLEFVLCLPKIYLDSQAVIGLVFTRNFIANKIIIVKFKHIITNYITNCKFSQYESTMRVFY